MIVIAEIQTAEGKLYLFVAIDRTGKFAVTRPQTLSDLTLETVYSTVDLGNHDHARSD